MRGRLYKSEASAIREGKAALNRKRNPVKGFFIKKRKEGENIRYQVGYYR